MGQGEDRDVGALEGKLCRELGPALRSLMIEHFSQPLREVDRTLFGDFRDIEHFIFHYFDRPSKEMDWQRGQAFDALARIFEQKQKFVSDSPVLKSAVEKVSRVSSATFSAKIAGYSSLNLDISVGSIGKIVDAFDRDFDSFRVFLEAFVPQAYGRVFNYSDSDRLDCEVRIPNSVAQAFNAVATPTPPSPDKPFGQQPGEAAATSAREKAEWLWRLANGSLLIPVALSLIVLYLGMSMLHDIGKSQQSMMLPIFEHQMKLLEEDRLRLIKEPAQTIPVAPAKSASSK